MTAVAADAGGVLPGEAPPLPVEGAVDALLIVIICGLIFLLINERSKRVRAERSTPEKPETAPEEISKMRGEIDMRRQSMAAMMNIASDLQDAKRELERERENLAEVNAALERRNAELDEFTSIASHDLQAPLRNIISWGEFLKRDLGEDLPPAAEEDVARMSQAARQMHELIDDLLELAKLGTSKLNREEIRLDDAIQTALTALQTGIEERGAEIEIEAMPVIPCDRTLVAQLFQNLAGNALKFTREGVSPVIRFTCEDRDGVSVLGVWDNGQGIPPQHLDTIFKPFKRLHRDDEVKGTGIGLAICRRAVERHGGEIWADSEPGAWSHIRFTLQPSEIPTQVPESV